MFITAEIWYSTTLGFNLTCLLFSTDYSRLGWVPHRLKRESLEIARAVICYRLDADEPTVSKH